MFRYLLICVPVLLVSLAGCSSDPFQQQTMVAMQVTEYQDATAFNRMIAELRNRGIKTTVLVNDTFAADNCDLIKQLDAEGFEIMAFARPTAAGGGSTTMSKLTYDEQYAFVSQIKSGIEACLGHAINGFRCTRFDQNEDTYKALQALGFQYDLAFVAQSDNNLPGHEDAILPYQTDPYGFWAVPMHCATWQGDRSVFCDNPWEVLPAEQWETLLKSELDRMDAEDRPLMVEFHPYFSAVDEGRWQAFVSFLDYAASKNVRFITTAEYVEWSKDAEAGHGSSGPWTPCPWD
jgi:hypothetical protein